MFSNEFLNSDLFNWVLLPLLIFLVLPRLEKEVIGKPDSDWLMVGVSSPSFSTVKQMVEKI